MEPSADGEIVGGVLFVLDCMWSTQSASFVGADVFLSDGVVGGSEQSRTHF